ncbi:MAG: nucleotidyltransferase family protein [Rhodospirillaceae bacterium]|jgi:N-acetyl-alpha-D-muramate 1-phosphate uridylyltransferase|nr:nucleotidyltransferase family protein [Rhodospirillaceae bacterium]MBT4464442.1 nucleotidyltransferase family protein [Rhodospirillaceae bacterium]MBT5308409.1 nucleotidyltransferase family protein [Rhodospirillaceae bacterium]MBT7356801.1 nucleotidyltransferase family protein [Rhodospirillaceae bacterium]
MSIPKVAMVLAAGFGIRMRPITETRPKPLVKVAGRSLLAHTIDRLKDVGVEKIIVNTHHLGEMIVEHLKDYQGIDIVFSPEDPILETGGGITKALDLLGDEPFFACNADTLWLNGSQDALQRLARHWHDDDMDALLLLHSTVDAYGYDGRGDFCADANGTLMRRPESEVAPYLFTGVQILHPRLFKDAPEGAFSLNVLYDKALEEDRLYGVVHDGEWFHIGTPDGLDEAETYMKLRYAGIKHR